MLKVGQTIWLPAVNAFAGTIPGGGIVTIASVEQPVTAGGYYNRASSDFILSVDQPVVDNLQGFAVNSPKPMAASGGMGYVAIDGLVSVINDDGSGMSLDSSAPFGTTAGSLYPNPNATGLFGLLPHGGGMLSVFRSGTLKQFCWFYTNASFTAGDSSVLGTITLQFGSGYDHSTTGITFMNGPADGAGYIFEGASGAYGIAAYSGTGATWYIIQMECP